MGNRRAHIIVKGHVQGVYFRATAIEVAREAGLSGTVRNTPAGTVEIVAEGAEEAVEELIRWCHTGPETARVDSVEVTLGAYTGCFSNFTVKQ